MASVSVIIPYYNQGKYLHTAVQSALSSYSGELEIIVVDDGSTESHANHYCTQARNLDDRVKIVRKANGGLSSARNAGLDVAQGEYIQFLDCDDAVVPNKIDWQVGQLVASKNKLVSVSGYYICNEWMGDLRDETQTVARFPLTLQSFLFYWERGFSIPIHCGLFHRSVFKKLRFNESLYGKEDWIFWTTLAGTQRNKFIFCPIVGGVYRLHGNGMTRSLDKMGESWVQATKLLAEQYGDEYPEFEDASIRWHSKFYKGARLSREEGLTVRTREAYSANQGSLKSRPSAALLHETSIQSADKPLVSFVVPIFNHREYLRQCTESIFNQKASINYEVVVIDDRSTDDGVIDLLCNIDSRGVAYRVFQNDENYGISITQNLAVERCLGEYIAFVDCDDFVEPNALDEMSRLLTASGAPDYIFTDRNHVDDGGRFIERVNYGGYSWIVPSGSVENDLLLGMIASHLKVIRKSLYIGIGGSDIAFSGVQDWELALRAINKGKFCYINKALYNHRIHSNSVSSTGSIAQLWMTNTLRRKHLLERSEAGEDSIIIEINEINLDYIPHMSKLFMKGIRFIYRNNKGSLDGRQINILREFNSYFDEIIVSMADSARLMGCLWDYRIVRCL
ncbi:glycosyltransferase family 2 protein [Brucella anthropi]|uniref:glycosyltransferase family 2 protein n=1 Tax=Brucella anthropi TaxID=529 RepID=UPI00028993CD|nr:glycosyltransferase family 2 protein [Brucella anthropi]